MTEKENLILCDECQLNNEDLYNFINERNTEEWENIKSKVDLKKSVRQLADDLYVALYELNYYKGFGNVLWEKLFHALSSIRKYHTPEGKKEFELKNLTSQRNKLSREISALKKQSLA